jgi:competence protein ComEC
MKKIRKIVCAIMCLFSVIALGSCDIEKIFEQFQKVLVDINYYIDGTLIDFVTVVKGEKVVLDLNEIYVYQEETTLNKYIESTLAENQEFDYWYTESECKNKVDENLIVVEELDLYGKIITNVEPVKLAAPVITVDENGKATWTAIENASGYIYQISGENEETTNNLFVELKAGQSVKVKSIGDNANYLNSEYSQTVTYTPVNPDPDPTPDPENPDDEYGIVETVVYDELQLHFLELGNEYAGDCTYIKAGDTDILIDAGSRKGSAATVKKYVDQYCTDGKLEYVIATHAHQDHIAAFVGNSSGGSRNGILYQYEVGTIIDFSLTDATSQIYEDYLTAVEMNVDKGTIHYTADQCWNETDGASKSYVLAEGITLNILYNKYYFEEASDENDYSVCTLISYNDKHFMLTGDLEHEGEIEMAKYYDGSTPEKTLPHCVLFKAGHHGSGSSSNEELLSKITPEIVTVCACAGATEYTSNYQNIFPTQAMISRVAKYTDRVYVTSMFNEKTLEFESLNGNIIVSSNGTKVGIEATNNLIKLKDSAWFNEIVYVVYNGTVGNITSGKGKEDFFTASTPNAVGVPRRVWPTE